MWSTKCKQKLFDRLKLDLPKKLSVEEKNYETIFHNMAQNKIIVNLPHY